MTYTDQELFEEIEAIANLLGRTRGQKVPTRTYRAIARRLNRVALEADTLATDRELERGETTLGRVKLRSGKMHIDI